MSDCVVDQGTKHIDLPHAAHTVMVYPPRRFEVGLSGPIITLNAGQTAKVGERVRDSPRVPDLLGNSQAALKMDPGRSVIAAAGFDNSQ